MSPAAVKRPAKAGVRSNGFVIVVGFVIGHAFLALFMREFRIIGLAHVFGSAIAGVLYAATTKKVRNVTFVIAYLVGCEVLWRMTKVAPFWEFAKYASLMVLLIALARVHWRRNRTLALAYFLLLLPSVAITLTSIPLSVARQDLSFNLSGPLLIAAAVLYFSNVRFTLDQVRPVFFALIGPAVGIAMLCYISATTTDLEFVNASNDHAAGGFGGNQVSPILGLAAMFLLFLTFDRRMAWRLRIPLLGLAVTLATQAVLTFSRGGVVLAFAGAAIAGFFMLRGNMRARVSIAVISMTISLVGKLVIEPRLDELTGGQLTVRYTSTQSTGRSTFIESELDMFRDNPVFGAGPGMGYYYRIDRDLKLGASHTEYSRMIGEHGLFGILSLVCLVLLGVKAVRGAKELEARAFAAALVVWAGLFLAIYGTRLAAPAFVFGLAFSIRTFIPAKSRA